MTLLDLPPVTEVKLRSPQARYHRVVSTTIEQRFVAGDESALKEIFDEHASLVVNICRRTVGGDAEDVAQQVFVSAWKGRESFDAERGSLAGWLTGIAKFKAIDHLRAKGRRPQNAGRDVEDSASSASDVGRVADRVLLTNALSRLPEERRRVLALAFFEDFTHHEISEHLAMPLGTVKSHVRRGLLALRDELGEHHTDPQTIGDPR